VAFGFQDPNGVLDQMEDMDEVMRASFVEMLERIAANPDPESDPDVLPLREPDYPDTYTATFDRGILAFFGPMYLPPIAYIRLIDVVWLDEWMADEDEDY